MVKKIFESPGPFPISKAVLHDNKYTLEVSGQIGVDAQSGALADGIEDQTKKTLENIRDILKKVGWNFHNVIKTRVYLADMKDYEKMNAVYKQYFTDGYPARVAFAVKELPRQALVEIECSASGDNVSDN